MTTRADYTDEEWARLRRAPLVAARAITLADPGGPIEAVKESSAAVRTVLAAAQSGEHGPLVQAVAQDVAETARQRENPMGGFKPSRAHPRADVLDELRAVAALLREKADPEERGQFGDLVRTAAQQAALAAKEGGFLGFHAVRVSEGEQQMLETLGGIFDPDGAAAAGDPPPA